MNSAAAVNVPRSATRQRIVEILTPQRALIALIMTVILVGAGLELIPPLILKRIIDDHLAVGTLTGLWQLAYLYLACVAVVQGLGFLSNYLTALAAQRALRDLRVQLYAAIAKPADELP